MFCVRMDCLAATNNLFSLEDIRAQYFTMVIKILTDRGYLPTSARVGSVGDFKEGCALIENPKA